MVVKYIKDFGSISPMEAFSDLGITKLATRVSELIREGEDIKKVPEQRLNRYWKKCRYMRYTME
jgi:hypothetical protein